MSASRSRADQANRRIRNLEFRHRAMRVLRDYFDAQGFTEVETPAMVPSPGMDVHLHAFEVNHPPAPYLITSPEYQMKRLLCAGMERIYQVSRCFRREELGDRHEPEFTMLEWYRANAGSEEVMQDTERLAHRLAQELTGSSVVRGVDLAPPWPRERLETLFERYAGVNMHELLDNEERFFRVYVDSIEPRLGFNRPLFVTHWPAQMASLARLVPDAPAYADRFEAYVGGVELCNGFGELTDPAEQRRRFKADQRERSAQGLPVYPIDERFLSDLDKGMPASGGNALGVDRLVALLAGAERIQDVMAFPRELLSE